MNGDSALDEKRIIFQSDNQFWHCVFWPRLIRLLSRFSNMAMCAGFTENNDYALQASLGIVQEIMQSPVITSYLYDAKIDYSFSAPFILLALGRTQKCYDFLKNLAVGGFDDYDDDDDDGGIEGNTLLENQDLLEDLFEDSRAAVRAAVCNSFFSFTVFDFLVTCDSPETVSNPLIHLSNIFGEKTIFFLVYW